MHHFANSPTGLARWRRRTALSNAAGSRRWLTLVGFLASSPVRQHFRGRNLKPQEGRRPTAIASCPEEQVAFSGSLLAHPRIPATSDSSNTSSPRLHVHRDERVTRLDRVAFPRLQREDV